MQKVFSMAKSKRIGKLRIVTLLLAFLMLLSFGVFALSACSTSEEEDDSSSETRTDTQTFSNADFEYFSDSDGSYVIGSADQLDELCRFQRQRHERKLLFRKVGHRGHGRTRKRLRRNVVRGVCRRTPRTTRSTGAASTMPTKTIFTMTGWTRRTTRTNWRTRSTSRTSTTTTISPAGICSRRGSSRTKGRNF